MPKKAAPAPFMQFALEFRAREEKKGRRFANMEDMIQSAGREWQQKTEVQKAFYRNKNQEYKMSEEYRTKTIQVRTSAAASPAVVQVCEYADEGAVFFEKYENMGGFFKKRERDRGDLSTTLTWRLTNIERDIVNEPFYVLTTENYYETPEHYCQPAEIAFLEFSLAKGITKQFSAILKPSLHNPPLAKSFHLDCGDESHEIYWDKPPSEGRDDFRPLIDEIKRIYADQQTGYPNQFRVYSLANKFNATQGAVRFFRDVTGSKMFIPYEKISCLEDLLILLYSFKRPKQVPSESDIVGFSRIAKRPVDAFDTQADLPCTYHKRCNDKRCALAVAKKLCFYLFTRVQKLYNLNLTENHIPTIYLAKSSRQFLENFDDFDDEDVWVLDQARVVAREAAHNEKRKMAKVAHPKKTKETPCSLPPSMLNLPGATDLTDRWRVERENVQNEARDYAETMLSSRKKLEQLKLPDGLNDVKWEQPVVFSLEKRRFVTVSDLQNGEESDDENN